MGPTLNLQLIIISSLVHFGDVILIDAPVAALLLVLCYILTKVMDVEKKKVDYFETIPSSESGCLQTKI